MSAFMWITSYFALLSWNGLGSFLRFGIFGLSHDTLVVVRNLNDAAHIPRHKHAVLDFVGLVQQYGYPAEEHQLTTEDGYNLKFHRIPGSPTNPKAPDKPVVFLQHGLLSSSDIFALVGPRNGLVYILADAGYDVWIGNIRGNVYGRSHVELSPDTDTSFWKFSLHEMATIDVSSMIDYILRKTHEKSLIFIGHSLGATKCYILLATKPEYNKKIRLVVSFAPAVFWRRNRPGWIQFLVKNGKFISKFLETTGVYEIFPRSSMNLLAADACKYGNPLQRFCLDSYFKVAGRNEKQLNSTFFPSVFYHYPAGTSTKLVMHCLQLVSANKFRAFDYGERQNYAKYNQPQPPDYNLMKVSAPVAIFYGGGDVTAAEQNIPDLMERLPNVVLSEKVPDENFNHMDFLYAMDVKRLLYDRVLQILEMYRN